MHEMFFDESFGIFDYILAIASAYAVDFVVVPSNIILYRLSVNPLYTLGGRGTYGNKLCAMRHTYTSCESFINLNNWGSLKPNVTVQLLYFYTFLVIPFDVQVHTTFINPQPTNPFRPTLKKLESFDSLHAEGNLHDKRYTTSHLIFNNMKSIVKPNTWHPGNELGWEGYRKML